MAAAAEAKKNGWFLAIAVVSNSGQFVHFSKIDQTQFGSIQIAIHKAEALPVSVGRPRPSRTASRRVEPASP